MDTTDGSNFLTYLRGWETMHTRNPDAQSRKSGVDTSTLATGVMANNWPTVRLRAFPWTRRNKRLAYCFATHVSYQVWILKRQSETLNCVSSYWVRVPTFLSLSLSMGGPLSVAGTMWCDVFIGCWELFLYRKDW